MCAGQNLGRCRAADPGGTRLDHRDRRGIVADSAGGLDAEASAHRPGHQPHRVDARATCRIETGGRLDEVRAGLLGGLAGHHELIVTEPGRFDDHLEHSGNLALHRSNLGDQVVVASGLQQADVDHHVDLVGTRGHRLTRLGRLDVGGVLAGREAADRRQPQPAQVDIERDHVGRDTQRKDPEPRCLGRRPPYVVGGRIGLQQRVIEVVGQVGASRFHDPTLAQDHAVGCESDGSAVVVRGSRTMNRE